MNIGDAVFQSGMPRQLQDYWIRGAGAARIRWGTPGAFDRCVRNLTQESGGTIADVKGTCANLYHEATGRWPGEAKEHGIIDLGAEWLETITASMGTYDAVAWEGPLAPIGTPTGDGRMFAPETLAYQTFPMPLRWQERSERGHDGAVTVGRIMGASERMVDGKLMIWGFGDFLNPDIIPEVAKALHQVEAGVSGPSVDLDSYGARLVEYNGKPVQMVSEGRIRAATLVAVPAFADLRLTLNPATSVLLEDTPDVEITIGDVAEFNVNPSSWKGAPLAPRDATFDADDAVKRIQAWASGDGNKMASMFLWIDPAGAAGGAILGREGYRLPWGDIIDGKPYLIYHAIYAAAALLEDGHGGLPNIPDGDKEKLRDVISQIYNHIAEEFDDPSIRASWDKREEASTMDTEEMTLVASIAPVHPPKTWFANPNLKGKTKPQVTEDGRVFGHLATWDGCHRGRMIATNVCTTPPRSGNNYAHFHTGTTKTAEGDLLDTGVIVWDTTHAPEAYGARAAVAHYEHTGQAVADVRVGEDKFGIWFSGSLRPGSGEQSAQKFRQTPLSGDWRRFGSRLELIGALAVNAPGFPILASVEGVTDLGVTVYFEGDVQTCLIASFGDMEESDVIEETTVAEEVEAVGFAGEAETVAVETTSSDEGCGCPDVAAKLADYKPLLMPDELKSRQQRVAEYERI